MEGFDQSIWRNATHEKKNSCWNSQATVSLKNDSSPEDSVKAPRTSSQASEQYIQYSLQSKQ
jgi:hypothetical protein